MIIERLIRRERQRAAYYTYTLWSGTLVGGGVGARETGQLRLGVVVIPARVDTVRWARKRERREGNWNNWWPPGRAAVCTFEMKLGRAEKEPSMARFRSTDPPLFFYSAIDPTCSRPKNFYNIYVDNSHETI